MLSLRREETSRSATSAPPNLLVFLFKDFKGEELDASGSMATTLDYYQPRVYCLILPGEKLLLLLPSVFLIFCHAGVYQQRRFKRFLQKNGENLPRDEETSP